MYGLTDNELEKLCNLFRKHEEIEQAILYGSRAKGNFKPFSDIDITLMGDKLTHSTLSSLSDEIDDLLLPYNVDLSIHDKLKKCRPLGTYTTHRNTHIQPFVTQQSKLNFKYTPSHPSPLAHTALSIGIQEVSEGNFKR